MTEHDWLTTNSPHQLLNIVGGKVSDRKLRCVISACKLPVIDELPERLRSDALVASDLLGEPDHREAAAERLREEVRVASRMRKPQLSASVRGLLLEASAGAGDYPFVTAHNTVSAMLTRSAEVGVDGAMRSWINSLIRDIGGNPFRPVACDPSWRSATAVGLAESIYADRAFDRLPILADALEDAGCTHPDVLTHCRGEGPHARGCWVVDLILGKA